MAWSRITRTVGTMSTATAAVLLWAVGAAIAADGARPPARSARKAEPRLPEVIRTQEHEDVDGRTLKPEASPKAPAPPALGAADLDALILKGLVAGKTPPSPRTTDEEFIRRAYLDVIGKLPAPGSIRQFVQSREKDKRARLIDGLLDLPDYAENWARYWRDVIAYRSPNEADRQVNYPSFEKWLAGQFAANQPWDRIATRIITATGRNDENGATAFALAEEGSPVEMAGEVSRVFLGIQIQCAQCHDHPSDPWKRQQFHEFAAFFSGLKSSRVAKMEAGKPPVFQVLTNGRTHYTMADLKDPEKKIPVAPRFFLGDGPRVSEQVGAAQRLDLAAGYVTGRDNPWFARAFINRVWYGVMGEGFYNPVDDLGPTRTPHAPEVLDLLAEHWQRSGYDVKWLFRVILNTEAYQRQSRSTDTAAGRVPFAANCPSRLRSDQIFDAIVHALDLDRRSFPDRPGGAPGPAEKAKGKGARAEKMADQLAGDPVPGRSAFNHAFGVDPSTPNDDVLGTIPQALALMNGPLVNRQIQARPGTMLGQLLLSTPDNRAVLDVLYLRVFARRPNAREVQACAHYLNHFSDRGEAFEDILWAMINSTEFLSRR